MSSRLSTMSPPSKPDQSLCWLANLHHIPAPGLLSGDTLSPETLKIMQENKKLAQRFRRNKSFFCAWLPVVGFPAKSRGCTNLFMKALDTVESDPAIYQAGLIACIHLLHVPTARSLIRMLRPEPGHIFEEEHLILYLGTILMAHQASPSVCSRKEAFAAAVLLDAIQWRAATDSVPPIVRLLEALVDNACEDLLPVNLVEQILAAYHYPENLSNHLEILRVECRWHEAQQLVKGLPAVLAIVELALISRANFPNHEMWAAWKPCQHRIELWRSPHLEPHRFALRSLLKLEGPDPTGKYIHAPTLRVAKYGKNSSDVDAALRSLDRCIAVGPESVALIAALSPFTSPNKLIEPAEPLILAVVNVNHEPAAAALVSYLHRLYDRPRLFTESVCPVVQMNIFSTLLSKLSQFPDLQHRFVKPCDLAPQAAQALEIGAQQFRRTADWEVLAAFFDLTKAFLAATWLHGSPWSVEFLGMLRQVIRTGMVWPRTTTPPPQVGESVIEWMNSPSVRPVQERGGRPARSAPKKKGAVVKHREWDPSEDQMNSGPSSARQEKEPEEEVVHASKPYRCRDVGVCYVGSGREEERDHAAIVIRNTVGLIKCPWAALKYSPSRREDEELDGNWEGDEEERGRDAGRVSEFIGTEDANRTEVVVGNPRDVDRKERVAAVMKRLLLEIRWKNLQRLAAVKKVEQRGRRRRRSMELERRPSSMSPC